MKKVDQNPMTVIGLSIVLGGLCAAGVSMLLLIIYAIFISAGFWGLDHVYVVACILCGVSCSLGSFWAVKQNGKHVLPIGIGTACIYFLSLTAVGMIISTSKISTVHMISFFLICLVGGALAGLAGGKRKKRRI